MFDSLYGGLEDASKANPKKSASEDDMFVDISGKSDEPKAAAAPEKDVPKPSLDVHAVEKTSAGPNPAVMAFAASKMMAPPKRKKVEAAKPVDLAVLQKQKEALLEKYEKKEAPVAVVPAPVQIHGTATGQGTVSRMAALRASRIAADEEDEEYDPNTPNDYEDLCRRRMRQKAEEEIAKRQQEDAERRRAAQVAKPEAPRPDDFATKMLKKMGWKEGEGLGKEGQGMSAPLVMQKTDTMTGKIVEGAKRPAPAQTASAAQDAKKSKPGAQAFNRPPTRVLLLQNLVGKGEVDEDLEGETAEEAGKYGKLIKCVVKEVPELPDDQAVRIFLEFTRVEEATKALVDMNGRYFGGRTVRARFYDEARWKTGDLLPKPGE